MPDYGPYGVRSARGRRLAPVLAAIAVAATVAVVSAGCGLASDSGPSTIVLPPTDALSTESEAVPTTTTSDDVGQTAQGNLPNWTMSRVIALAPRVDNGRFRQGADGPDAEVENTSGVHFSTADRRVRCSTGYGDTSTLTCRTTDSRGAPRPASAPAGCRWDRALVVLTAEGPEHGACGERYPVLERSSIIDDGSTISIGLIQCLSQDSGLYCIQTRSGHGFAIAGRGYRTIEASERAPSDLVGLPGGGESDAAPSSETDPTSETVPTTTR